MRRHYRVNSSHGTFYARNADVALALNPTINAVKESGASCVLILPSGNIINFLTATHSPSREITFLPPTLPTSSEEQEFLARMQANSPELIVYVDISFLEWGYLRP